MTYKQWLYNMRRRRLKIMRLLSLGYSEADVGRRMGISQQRIGQIRSMEERR